DLLQDVEHILARGKRELEIELAELELPIRAQIFVSPGGRDLVVAVEPADHEQLLEELRRLRQREEVAGLQPGGDEEVARTFGGAERHRRGPDVDEALLLHRAADRGDHRGRKTEVALHPLTTEIEIAVAEPQRLLDSFAVELA